MVLYITFLHQYTSQSQEKFKILLQYIAEGFLSIVSLTLTLCASAMRQNKQWFNPADTNALVAAVGFGKGLSKCRPPASVAPGHSGQTMMTGGPTLQQVTIAGAPGHQAGIGTSVAQQQPGQPGRTWTHIRTHKHTYTHGS